MEYFTSRLMIVAALSLLFGLFGAWHVLRDLKVCRIDKVILAVLGWVWGALTAFVALCLLWLGVLAAQWALTGSNLFLR